MILFNTTFVVTDSANADFRNWISSVFIPDILSCDSFSDILLTKILSNPQEDERTQSFALQFKAPSIGHVEDWIATTGIHKLNAIQAKYGENILYFATPMEILD